MLQVCFISNLRHFFSGCLIESDRTARHKAALQFRSRPSREVFAEFGEMLLKASPI